MTTEEKIVAYRDWVAFRCWFRWTRLTIMFNSGMAVGLLLGRVQTLKDVLEGIVPVQAEAVKKVITDEIRDKEAELEEVFQGKHG